MTLKNQSCISLVSISVCRPINWATIRKAKKGVYFMLNKIFLNKRSLGFSNYANLLLVFIVTIYQKDD